MQWCSKTLPSHPVLPDHTCLCDVPEGITWSDFKADLVYDESKQAFVYRPDQ